MKILRDIVGLKKALNGNINLGFVPTMGGLHNGHISLIKKSQQKCKKTLVSIYVNPKQFNKPKDFLLYPRNLNKDLTILKKLKINYIFLPKKKEIFKDKHKKIILPKNQNRLCAKIRKGHFEGVLDIMERFIKIIKPKYIFMGDKDFQQLFLINKFIIKRYNSKIYRCKTIRSKNFVALSSRNFLLNKEAIKSAGFIAKNLYKFKYKLKYIKRINKYILNKKKELMKLFDIKIEYLEARNESDLKIYRNKGKFKLFISYYIDKVRLIDNF